MCKQTMPAGMLGLMLGGMIFATASSLNATLNISAGVFTNDIFKRLRPAAGETTLMKVARISTLGFGVLAIAVALLIPNMGGIVNVACGRRLLAQPGRRDAGRGALPRAAADRL